MELFADTFVPIGLGDVWFRSRHCPACGSASLQHASGADVSHWLCPDCSRCWQPVHGKLRRVDPLSCHGCASRPRNECVALFASGFPTFGSPYLD